ncbi:hypothetical protein Pint_12500 [Pistacia integerrima]|uniref:Uncharacterized protein n=1 Tax=Pistacia integerrima TaxID=434235 RepID=A0ACC0YAL6_9ROSI|nr:hypothetical protein Pint_12500 [Pistacia integerrima]
MLELDQLGFSLWLSSKPSKRWGELTVCLGKVVPYKLYEYLLLGLVSAVPSFLISMLLIGKVNTSLLSLVFLAMAQLMGNLVMCGIYPRVAVDGLGAAMLVTILIDLWQIFLGPIVPLPETKQCLQPGLPWFPEDTNQT